MSTNLAAYLNYMSTWDGESKENIDAILKKHDLFINLDNFDLDSAIDREFEELHNLACSLCNQTIALNSTQILANAVAVTAI